MVGLETHRERLERRLRRDGRAGCTAATGERLFDIRGDGQE
jgi:hypothetical protein